MDWEVRRVSGLGAVAAWLRWGRAALVAELVCRRCGHRTSAGAGRALSPVGFAGRVRHAFVTLSWARSARPFPLTYVIAAAVGGVIGIALQWWRGWDWWLIAVVFVAGVWLVFASSVFWGDRHRRAGPPSVLFAIAPQRAQRIQERRRDEALRRVTIPLYGLGSSFTGERWLGGWGGSDDEVHALTLAHGEAFRSCLRVEMSRAPHELRMDGAERELAHNAAIDRLGEGADMGELMRVRAEIMRERAGRGWDLAVLDVDGTHVRFRTMTEGRFWFATGEKDGIWLGLHGEGFPIHDVALVRVEIEPYLEGSRRMNEARRRDAR